MTGRLTDRTELAVVAVALFALAAAGYFLLIAPKRSEGARLERELARVSNAPVHDAGSPQSPRVALAHLMRAMPDKADTASVVLELQRLANQSGLAFTAITPLPASTVAGFPHTPLQTVFEGRFANVSRFLARLRGQVQRRDGRLVASGRLYMVDGIDLAEGEARFPRVKATITLGTILHAPVATATSAAAPVAAGAAAPAPSG